MGRWATPAATTDTMRINPVDLEKFDYQLDVRLNQQAYERHDLPAEVCDK